MIIIIMMIIIIYTHKYVRIYISTYYIFIYNYIFIYKYIFIIEESACCRVEVMHFKSHTHTHIHYVTACQGEM